MSEPFVGEIRMFAGNFAPRSWAFCDGQLLAVSQNDALFSLFGTIYGGDGRTTFGLPDLQGRIPVHQGSGPGLTNRRLGAKFGAERVTLTTNQLPPHGHRPASKDVATLGDPNGRAVADTGSTATYAAARPQIMGEEHAVTLSEDILLDNEDVVLATLLVYDPVSRRFFTEGFDYDVIGLGAQTAIRIRPGGALDPGVDPMIDTFAVDYIHENPAASMAPEAMQNSGGSQPHNNLMPYLVIHFIVALFGVYPSRT